MPATSTLVEAHIMEVGLWVSSTRPVQAAGVALKTVDDRFMAVMVGPVDVAMLAMLVAGTPTSRPLTHPFYGSLLAAAGAEVDRVVIDALADEVFHAKVVLSAAPDGIGVDARPSDALALSVVTGCRIFVHEDVLGRAAMPMSAWKPSWVAKSAAELASEGLPRFWRRSGAPDPHDSAPAAVSEGAGSVPLLSRREEQVLRLVAAGNTNIEVSHALGLSPYTVTRHLSNVYSKLGVTRRAQAVTFLPRRS